MSNCAVGDSVEDSLNRFSASEAAREVEDSQLDAQDRVQNEDKEGLDQRKSKREVQEPAEDEGENDNKDDDDEEEAKDQDRNHPPARADLEFHYNESSTAGRLLTEILQDLVSFKEPQTWDKLQHTNQLKKVAKSAKRYLETLPSGEASELLNYSMVEDVSILNKIIGRRPVGSSSEAYFFLSKFIPPEEATASIADMPKDLCNLCWSQGRIVQITETASSMQRPPLLLLHCFCLRLQNEDTAFIREFIQRHIEFRHTLKTPGHFQPMTPSDTDASTRVCYRRLSYSCHLPHFLLEDVSSQVPNLDIPDLKRIEPFEPMQSATAKDSLSLCQVSSSVLLTFVLPEESTSRREELDFLTTPQALWTILTVNCIRRRSSISGDFHEAPPTPVAQFMAGIHGALQTQRLDEQHILDALRSRLAESDDMRLVDDDNFTKSHLYHWVVKTCDKVCHSISTTLRFTDRISRGFVTKLGAEGHASKPPGIEFWQEKWMQEVADLKELREEFLSCRQDVQERRNALHGATAVLEARLAYQQGERIKVLTYLAIIYLPLGASASIYSINPLPQPATLGSYFIFLVILFLVTALVGAGITNLFAKTSTTAGISGNFLFESWKLLAGWFSIKYNDHLANYLRYLKAIFTPPKAESSGSLSLIYKFDPPASRYWDEEWGWSRMFFKWFYKFCVRALHRVVVPWMALPRTLIYRFLYQSGGYSYSWSLYQAARDTFVILLSPAAVALFVCFTCLVILVDIVATIWHRVRRSQGDRDNN